MAERIRDNIAASWAARGFSCELWTDPPGRAWEDFTHATDELVTVLEGEMEFGQPPFGCISRLTLPSQPSRLSSHSSIDRS